MQTSARAQTPLASPNEFQKHRLVCHGIRPPRDPLIDAAVKKARRGRHRLHAQNGNVAAFLDPPRLRLEFWNGREACPGHLLEPRARFTAGKLKTVDHPLIAGIGDSENQEAAELIRKAGDFPAHSLRADEFPALRLPCERLDSRIGFVEEGSEVVEG